MKIHLKVFAFNITQYSHHYKPGFYSQRYNVFECVSKVVKCHCILIIFTQDIKANCYYVEMRGGGGGGGQNCLKLLFAKTKCDYRSTRYNKSIHLLFCPPLSQYLFFHIFSVALPTFVCFQIG